MTTRYVLPLIHPEAQQRVTAGGKGAMLAKLLAAGYPVPDGFVLVTQAYRDFVQANGLDGLIHQLVPSQPEVDPQKLEAISQRIRSALSTFRLPSDVASELVASYEALGEPTVAVRSSATTEDLPDLSFAGQQDTFLNVYGRDALLKAVLDCWSSLWTARAISYRLVHGVPQHDLAMAVVVQRMVPSLRSGVMFTANPVTGVRSEVVVEAVVGLGDALVSARLQPDQWTVRLGDPPAVAERGSIQPASGEAAGIRELATGDLLALARMGKEIEGLFGSPQDIEWAWDGQQSYILQARPITSLFPLPPGVPPSPLRVLFSFGAVQGVLEPLTPMGRCLIAQLVATAAGLLGYRVTSSTQRVLYTAGERLWVDITPLLHSDLGRKACLTALGIVEPTTARALRSLFGEYEFRARRPIKLLTVLTLGRLACRMAANVVLSLLRPEMRWRKIAGRLEAILQQLEADLGQARNGNIASLTEVPALMDRALFRHLYRNLLPMLSMVAAAVLCLNLLRRMAAEVPEGLEGRSQQQWQALALEVGKAPPNDPTVRMGMDLWRLASQIREDAASLECLRALDARQLAEQYEAARLPGVAQRAIHDFMKAYGQRGPVEIDVGRPRWKEDAAPVFDLLKLYVQMRERGEDAADELVRRGGEAEAAMAQLQGAVRRLPFGWVRSWLVGLAGRRLRQLAGFREYPKFFMVRAFGLIREYLLALGAALREAGLLEKPYDVMFLSLDELAQLPEADPKAIVECVESRRATFQCELRRLRVPRLLLTDGRALYGDSPSQATQAVWFQGSPASPGVAEGRVRVVLNPRHAFLEPGEILVCPGTDPSWTPLFLAAGGLVTEVGGIMTHGAVVARELGLPAVVGLHAATMLLRTGQRVRIDGSTGLVEVLEA